jgi:hypothetical protein
MVGRIGEHWHSVMAVEGTHGWSDLEIADAINEIEKSRSRATWEKYAHVDFEWENGNEFHNYVGREHRVGIERRWQIEKRAKDELDWRDYNHAFDKKKIDKNDDDTYFIMRI